MSYNFKEIEKKWQEIWDKEHTFAASDDFSRPKFYALVEFPYPSAQGLHVGHPRSYTAMDILARLKRLQGYNVLYPMGWDAFGLPTENFALKNKIHPAKITAQNVDNFRRQLKSLGFSFDWDREVDTTSAQYYKWTQWIFLKLFENDLAYKAEMPINWCTSCKVGLANEEVVDGVCERCGADVVQKMKEQWMLRITKYAQRLIDDLDEADYLEKIKSSQINWIGRSEGAEVDFEVCDKVVNVYTTRPDTLFGATYMVLSPEHPLLEQLPIQNRDDVNDYAKKAKSKTEFERSQMTKEKTGVRLEGVTAKNPINGAEMPVFISDYVLMSYGKGAIMAVPGHDTRDYEFAKKFGLPIIQVVDGDCDLDVEAFTDVDSGIMINSGFLDGMSVKEAIAAMIDYLEKNGKGARKVNYKLRDWVFSRQRYWGEPIPLVNCEKCGMVPVEIPLILPEIDDFEPGENGESPLARQRAWVNTSCPKCGGAAKRETDTMPQWAGSSWYFLRYADPHNSEMLASRESLDYWLPVDWYNGGMEHTTLHLLYSRFWHKFLYDLGVVNTKEPYMKRTSHGMILGENNEKMSKSRGNVVNPDDVVEEYGADTFRAYEMFIGAFDQATPWATKGVKGCFKFLERVWNLQGFLVEGEEYSPELEVMMHKTIKKVGSDYLKMKFNTAIAQMMSLVNDMYRVGKVTHGELRTLLILLNPVCPHITEEIWQLQGYSGAGVFAQTFPEYDESKTVEDTIELVVQINGRLKGKTVAQFGMSKEELEEFAKTDQTICQLLEGRTVKKIVAVPNKLVNLVV